MTSVTEMRIFGGQKMRLHGGTLPAREGGLARPLTQILGPKCAFFRDFLPFRRDLLHAVRHDLLHAVRHALLHAFLYALPLESACGIRSFDDFDRPPAGSRYCRCSRFRTCLDAFIALRSSQPGESARKTLAKTIQFSGLRADRAASLRALKLGANGVSGEIFVSARVGHGHLPARGAARPRTLRETLAD